MLAGVAFLAVRAYWSPAKPAAGPYPSALVADGDFATSALASARGTFQSLNEVSASAGTVVAVGSESDARLGRAQFFVSTDGGRSWRLSPVTATDGGAPPTSDVPNAVAGGHGAWLALGPGASWISKDGRAWTRTAGNGLGLQPGDEMQALTRTATGFIAGGGSAPSAGAPDSEPVIWSSADGTSWHRVAGQQTGLSVPGGTVGKILIAATHGPDTVIAAQVTKPPASGEADADLFRSTDGGRTWTAVSTPAGGDAGSWVSGLAPSAHGFVVLRPGTNQAGAPDAAVFVSADGSSWHYSGTIDAPEAEVLTITGLSGSTQGTVCTGQLGNGTRVAYESLDGRSWRRVAIPGTSAATSLVGATVTTGGTVVEVGSRTSQAGVKQGFLWVSGAPRQVVDVAKIPGAFFPALTVQGIAVSDSHPGTAATADVAVGSAGTQPAVWYSPGGGNWYPARGAAPAVFGVSGTTGLSAVVDSPGGWLSAGGASGPAGQPIVVVSPDGRTWQAAGGIGALAAPGASARGVAYGHGGYVVVGEQEVQGRSIAAAWWSPRLFGTVPTPAAGSGGEENVRPATLWNRAGDTGHGDLDGPGASREMLGVTSAGSGFVAVGSVGSKAAAWTSPDGHRWKLTDLPQPTGGQAALQFVASSGNEIVAAGTADGASNPVPFAEVSGDAGQSWQQAQLPAPSGHSQVTGLTAADGGFVATGGYGPSGRTAVVVWTSSAGRRWKDYTPHVSGLAGPGTDEITALSRSGAQLLGVGFTASQTTEHTTLWRAPPFPSPSTGGHRGTR